MYKFFILFSFFVLGCSSFDIEQVNSDPQQTIISPEILTLNGFKIEKVAIYDLEAVILSKRSYSDELEDLIPFDFVLAWKDMTNRKIVDSIKITQSNRWFHFYYKDENIKDIVQKSSSNTHIIPLNEEIKEKLEGIDLGKKYRLKGFLVNVVDFNMKTSLTRSDFGAGACEIFLVEEVAEN